MILPFLYRLSIYLWLALKMHLILHHKLCQYLRLLNQTTMMLFHYTIGIGLEGFHYQKHLVIRQLNDMIYLQLE